MSLTIAQAKVQRQREELARVLDIYETIADALEGETAVKSKGVRYLPYPAECEQETDKRYIAYRTRALYYNVCQPTRDALVGQIFLRPPMIELPEQLNPIVENTNGEGLSLSQLIKKAANYVLPFGRGGFLADFPTTNGPVTKGEIDKGIVRPVIRFFEPWAIRNWRVQQKGTIKKLIMLVLDEPYEPIDSEDDFNVEVRVRQRAYVLKNNRCTCSVWEDGKKTADYVIKDYKGEPLDFIPFEFIGSENNDPDIDEPPFENLANLNIAHYRNSADYEESVYLVGQPTPVYTG
jgi:hypothetical protein